MPSGAAALQQVERIGKAISGRSFLAEHRLLAGSGDASGGGAGAAGGGGASGVGGGGGINDGGGAAGKQGEDQAAAKAAALFARATSAMEALTLGDAGPVEAQGLGVAAVPASSAPAAESSPISQRCAANKMSACCLDHVFFVMVCCLIC